MTAGGRSRRPQRPVAAAVVLGSALCLVGCGASGAKAAGDGSANDTAAAVGGAGAAAASDVGGASGAGQESSRAGTTDVCALLTPADANAVAHQQGLAGDQTASTVYQLTAEKQTIGGTFPSSACKFTIVEQTSDGPGAEAIISMQVQSAIHLDASGTKVSGLGDEAYDDDGQTEVRVGDLMLEAGENSATDDFAVALYRVMIPNLRAAK